MVARLISSRPVAVVLLVLALVGHVGLQLLPAWNKVSGSGAGRDFASYHYAVHVAADGGDPYDVDALTRAARADRTRKSVQPYFYPPPFLFAVWWAAPLSLRTAALAMLVLNEALLFACLAVLVGAFRAPLAGVALLLVAYTPIPDNAWMGQANLIALLPALGGLALATRRPWLGGALVGTAAMFKMSPALFLLWFVARGNLRAVFGAVAAAVGLSAASLVLLPLDVQVRFYTEVLPGFFSGSYHGLTVPISLEANHSVPDLFDRVWDHPRPTQLSPTAQRASHITALALLSTWFLAFRQRPVAPPVPVDTAVGALTVLMVALPAYTYEHHLVFLLPAVLAAARVAPIALFLPTFFFLAWPLPWLGWAKEAWPAGAPLVRESKFIAEAALFALLVAYGRRK